MNSPRNTFSARRPRAPEPSWFWVVTLSGFLCGMLVFTACWYMLLPEPNRQSVVQKILSASEIFPGLAGFNQPMVLLVMGVDMPPTGQKTDYDNVRTDTMMLVKLDTWRKKVNIVSIPRDSKVYLANQGGINKINAAFPIGGPELAVATVQNTFGVAIDHYLVINVGGVKDVVDTLDGVDVYIEKRMQYRDRTAGLNIALEPGKHHLNGSQAEGFLRFRHDAYGDIGRIRRQQQFLGAVTAKLSDPATLLKLKPLLEASEKYVLTDMSVQDLIRLVLSVKDMKRSDFQVATLPGHASTQSQVSYWVINPEQAEAVLNRLIIGMDADPWGAPKGSYRVGILYTPGHKELLPTYKKALEHDGFEIVCQTPIRNHTTQLVTHNAQAPRSIQRQLQGIHPVLEDAQLIFAPHGATFETNACGRSDFTLILGEDTRSSVRP